MRPNHRTHGTDAPACTYWQPLAEDVPSWSDPMLWWQDGLCAFCGFADRLVLDHDHTTGLERGYLCPSCNGREAYGQGPAWGLWRGTGSPAAILAHVRTYVSAFGVTPIYAQANDDVAAKIAAAVVR